jgi:hypothetical protein
MRSSYETNRLQALYHPVITSMLWYSSANLVEKYDKPEYTTRVFILKYENLVAHPKDNVQNLCQFLNLDYTDDLIQVSGNNSSFESVQAENGIFTTSIDRWRTFLTPNEVWWAQTINRKHMNAFRYEIDSVNPNLRKLVLEILIAPWSLIKAVYVNVNRRGPVLGYVWRRLLAFFRR